MCQGSEQVEMETRWHPTPEILIVAMNFNLTMKWVVMYLEKVEMQRKPCYRH